MLLDEKTLIKLSKKNINHFKSLGYDGELRDIIEVNTKDINIGSHLSIRVKCDICGNEKVILFQKYIKNINNGNFYACSSKCAQDKVKKTSLNKFGVEYYVQTDEYKQRVIITSNDNYGCEHFTQSNKVKNEAKKTFIENYGVDSPFKSEMIKEKIKLILIEKYGVDNVFKNEKIKEKIRKTFNINYGVNWSSQNEMIKNKQKNTNIERFGVDNVFKLNWVKDKARKNYFDIYGVPFGTLTEDMLLKMKNTKVDKWMDVILKKHINLKLIKIDFENKIYTFKCENNHIFDISFHLLTQRNKSDTTICTICNSVEKHVSGLEIQLKEYIKENYNGETIENKKIISPYEIDIFLPELKIGFEFNGLYWHSDARKSDNYHYNKTKISEDNNINLIQIFEDDWKLKKEIIKSNISKLLNKSKNLELYDYEIKKIYNIEMVRNFLNDNHINGYISTKINIGIFKNDELMSLICFKNRKNYYELIRYCDKLYYKIDNSFKLLFDYFIDNYAPKKIITYINKNWNNKELFENNGFVLSKIISPDYYIIINKTHRINNNYYNRKNYINNLKIYDSGHLEYKYVM